MKLDKKAKQHASAKGRMYASVKYDGEDVNTYNRGFEEGYSYRSGEVSALEGASVNLVKSAASNALAAVIIFACVNGWNKIREKIQEKKDEPEVVDG